LPEACLIYMVPTSVCLLAVNGDMTISRCELAKILHKEDLDGFEGYSLATVRLCLAFMESNFNISKEHENSDGSFDYGIFQINSHYWYNAYQSHPENFCHVDCRGLARVPGCLSKITSNNFHKLFRKRVKRGYLQIVLRSILSFF
uniref:Lysozyme-like protein 6 n=1 Tax=Castor canadensis TaxID=51338 RepID=A0A8C0XNJ7_CASCN